MSLVFASDVTSRTADVGDKIALTLAEDLKLEDVVLVKKGAPAVATVTEANRAGAGGRPGYISFQANSLNVNSSTVKLRGTAAKEGREKQVSPATIGLAVLPAGLLLERGNEAEIKQGTAVTAIVDADIALSAHE